MPEPVVRSWLLHCNYGIKRRAILLSPRQLYNRILTLYKDSVITSQRKDEVEAMYKAAVAAERAAYEQYQMAVDGAKKKIKRPLPAWWMLLEAQWMKSRLCWSMLG